MSRKLKIYACSGIGEADSQYSYWLDNTQTVSNTQAVNSLLSMINLNYSEVQNLGLTTQEKLERLNQIDMYSVAIYYAQVYNELPEDLHRAGQVIGCLLDKGVFDYDSLSNEERDKHLDDVFEKVADVINDDTLKASDDFTKWWKRIIEDRNKVGLSVEEQNAINSVLEKQSKEISGIGASDDWKKNKDLAQYLNKAGEYFLYTYFTDEQLKRLPKKFKLKKRVQKQTYNYCKAMFVGVYGSESEMKDVIRSGIIREFKAQPENVCSSIYNKHLSGIGDAVVFALVVELIVALVPLIKSLVEGICNCVAAAKVAKYSSIDKQVAAAATPNGEDFDDISGSDSSGSVIKNGSTLLLVAVAAALYLIFKK